MYVHVFEEKIMVLHTNPKLHGNHDILKLVTLGERELEVKFISRAKNVWETRCIVFIKERRTGQISSKVLCSNLLIRLEDLFLKVTNKDHLLSQARSELMRQEHQI